MRVPPQKVSCRRMCRAEESQPHESSKMHKNYAVFSKSYWLFHNCQRQLAHTSNPKTLYINTGTNMQHNTSTFVKYTHKPKFTFINIFKGHVQAHVIMQRQIRAHNMEHGHMCIDRDITNTHLPTNTYIHTVIAYLLTQVPS